MKKKGNKGLVVSLIIFIIIAIGLAGYIVYDKDLLNLQKNTEVKEENKEKEETTEKEEVTEEKQDTVSNNLSFDIIKCVNCDTQNYDFTVNTNGTFGDAVINSNRKKVNIRLNYDLIKEYNNSIQKSGISEYYEIEFSQNVNDVIYADFGLDASEANFLFLLEDGTIEYMPIIQAALNDTIKSYGKISNLRDIVKLYKVQMASKQYAGADITYLAQSSDGTLYNLHPLLQN